MALASDRKTRRSCGELERLNGHMFALLPHDLTDIHSDIINVLDHVAATCARALRHPFAIISSAALTG